MPLPHEADDRWRSLADVFVAAAHRHADRTALVVGGRAVTYAELDDLSSRWAGVLVDEGERRRVGILAARSLPAYAGVLAAAKAGAAFVPLNPSFPAARLRDTARRAGVDVVVVDRAGLAKLAAPLAALPDGAPVLAPDAGAFGVRGRSVLDGATLASAPALDRVLAERDGLAYVLFTSGSTGTPKVVPIRHDNLMPFLAYNHERYGLTPDDRVSQFFEQTFDPSIFDLFVAWAAGAAVCVPSYEELRSPIRFAAESGLTSWYSVPSLVSMLERRETLRGGELPGLRWSLFCGEALPVDLARRWSAVAPNSTVENVYGPTELTITCAVHRWDPAEESSTGMVPIGRVYPHCYHVVVDGDGRPVSSGEPGELCVGGPQRFGGYLDDAEATEARTITVVGDDGIARDHYRTGDRVAWEGAGYTFLGRVDHEVKILGYRIQPGEVEHALRRCEGVVDAAVVPHPMVDGAPRGLAAFVTGPTGPQAGAAIRTALQASLPGYMVPEPVVVLDGLPLNPNGKVDRAALELLL